VEEQGSLIQCLRTNNIQPFIDSCDVEMPSLFTIQFPASQIDPRHPAEAMGQVQIQVEPRASSTSAVVQQEENKENTSGVVEPQ
jgi:hypothetical protein